MKRELLEKPFDKSQIKQREGHFGTMLDYIEGHAVIQRNRCFNNARQQCPHRGYSKNSWS
jgi:hypothetical protein